MEFVSPPPHQPRQRSEKWINVVAELKANPGEWAKVGNFSPGVATHIRRGKYPAFLDGCDHEQVGVYMESHWEVTTRKTDNGTRNDVYIRWIG